MIAALKLFRGDEVTNENSGDEGTETRRAAQTLGTVFRDTVRPILEERRRAVSTVEDYERSVRLWEELTGDPLLASINERTLDLFANQLAERHISSRTQAKHMGYLQTVLNLCGPQRRERSRGGLGRPLGLLDSVPVFELPEQEEPMPKRVPSRDEVAGMLASVDVAKVPIRQPALKWRAALLLLDWCGIRRNDLFSTLRVKHWIDSPECPVPSIRHLTWEHGWISFVPEKTKRVRKRPLVIPLSPQISDCLRQITRVAGAIEAPLLGFAKCGHVQWYREFKSIQAAAGITEPYGFHDLRKACNMAWNLDVAEGIGARFLGHAAKGVNQRSYMEEVAQMVRAAEKRLEFMLEKLRESQLAKELPLKTIGDLKKAMATDEWWHKKVKGFGATKVDLLTDALVKHADKNRDDDPRPKMCHFCQIGFEDNKCPKCGNSQYFERADEVSQKPDASEETVEEPADTDGTTDGADEGSSSNGDE